VHICCDLYICFFYGGRWGVDSALVIEHGSGQVNRVDLAHLVYIIIMGCVSRVRLWERTEMDDWRG
jgi:hypothetical protein